MNSLILRDEIFFQRRQAAADAGIDAAQGIPGSTRCILQLN
jgi:hypothetical protein